MNIKLTQQKIYTTNISYQININNLFILVTQIHS